MDIAILYLALNSWYHSSSFIHSYQYFCQKWMVVLKECHPQMDSLLVSLRISVLRCRICRLRRRCLLLILPPFLSNFPIVRAFFDRMVCIIKGSKISAPETKSIPTFRFTWRGGCLSSSWSITSSPSSTSIPSTTWVVILILIWVLAWILRRWILILLWLAMVTIASTSSILLGSGISWRLESRSIPGRLNFLHLL